MQTRFRDGKIIPQTKIEKLEILRKNYYTQLIREIETLRIRRRQLIISYKQTAKELDEEIRKENNKEKA